MRRMGALANKIGHHGSTRSMNALDEQAALQDALDSAAFIMNDEIERAETELSKGTSPYHKLGRATALFLRAALGFEKEIMEQAGARLAEAEDAASEHQRRAIRDPSTAHNSKIYPPGAEYALCHAETQLMSAVVGVLNESLTESLRGFYKLRKAFGTLSEISAAEKRFLEKRNAGAESSLSSSTTSVSTVQEKTVRIDVEAPADDSGVLTPDTSDNDDDLEFLDAKGWKSNTITPAAYEGHLEYLDVADLKLNEAIEENISRGLSSSVPPAGVAVQSEAAAQQADHDVDFRTITSDPIDLFIHSGTALCFGLLQLILSLVPPAFAKLLSIFSFRGDRENGLRLLYSATKFKHNINGAMAGLMYLGYHTAALAPCDIKSKDALPENRLRSLLSEMRDLYPKSKLWLLEESRMLSRDFKLEAAVDLVANAQKSPLKQVEALGTFEMSLNLMYLHRYQECADGFIKCVGLNSWSHALYFYIAGACHVELYRIHKDSDPEKAKEHAAKVKKYLPEVLVHAGKKHFMAKRLPFDVFVSRKVTKWEARAKARDCDLVDAVGVSPLNEMIYFWSGYRRMREEQLHLSLQRLAWSEDLASWEHEAADERTILGVLRGVCYRNLKETAKAKDVLTKGVLCQDLHDLKACENPDTWPLPVAHYEMAVCYWQEAGGEDGDKALLTKCSEELTKVAKGESFELEARVGLKIATARETLKKAGIETS